MIPEGWEGADLAIWCGFIVGAYFAGVTNTKADTISRVYVERSRWQQLAYGLVTALACMVAFGILGLGLFSLPRIVP